MEPATDEVDISQEISLIRPREHHYGGEHPPLFIDRLPPPGVDSLSRLNSDHTCTELFTDVCISNGIDFSPDGKTMCRPMSRTPRSTQS